MDRSYELGAVVKCLGDSDEPMNQLVRFHVLTEVYLDIFITFQKLIRWCKLAYNK